MRPYFFLFYVRLFRVACTHTDLYSMCNNFGDTASNELHFHSEDCVVTADVKFALDSCWTFVRFWFAIERAVVAVAGDAVAAVAGDVGPVAVGATIAVAAPAVVEFADGDSVTLVADSMSVLWSEFLYPLQREKERKIEN